MTCEKTSKRISTTLVSMLVLTLLIGACSEDPLPDIVGSADVDGGVSVDGAVDASSGADVDAAPEDGGVAPDAEPEDLGTIDCGASSELWTSLGGALDTDQTAYAYTPAIASDGRGNLAVAWHEMLAGYNYCIYVKRWDGSSWVPLGSYVDQNAHHNSQSPSLAIDTAGHPVVTWGESQEIYVKRWDGSDWTQLGDSLRVGPANDCYASAPSLVLDAEDNPSVAWYEWDSNLAKDVYVKQWNGSAWVQLGNGSLDIAPADSANAPSLVLDRDGRPIVAWNESDSHTGSLTRHDTYVKRWNGSDWTLVGNGPLVITPGNHTYSPSIAVDSSNQPVVALYDFDVASSHTTVFVLRWNGSDWEQVGGAVAVDPSAKGSAPSLVLSRDQPIVAFGEGTSSDNSVVIMRFDGIDWVAVGAQPLDHAADETAYGAVVTLDPCGRPIVAWNEWEENDASFNIYVSRFE